MMIHVILLVLFLAAPAFSAEDPADTPNLHQPREKIFTAGQPTEAGLQSIIDRGARVVINLRPHDEPSARDESEELEKNGIPYYSIPITPDTITVEKVKQFSCILKDSKEVPVLIHCASGNRVGGLWLLYRVFSENSDVETALAEAREIGMNPKLEPVVLKLVDEYRANPPDLTCP